MPSPECQQPNTAPTHAPPELVAALADIDRRLEIADANENLIERTFKREQLLELCDQIEAEIEEAASPLER